MSASRQHVAVRQCVGCNARDQQSRMDRFTLVAGRLEWDRRRLAPGRGAYLHRDPQCRERFLTRKTPARSLRASLGKAERAKLLEEVW